MDDLGHIHTALALRLAEIAAEAREEAAGHADVYVREELLRIAKGLDRVIDELAKPRTPHAETAAFAQTPLGPNLAGSSFSRRRALSSLLVARDPAQALPRASPPRLHSAPRC